MKAQISQKDGQRSKAGITPLHHQGGYPLWHHLQHQYLKKLARAEEEIQYSPVAHSAYDIADDHSPFISIVH